MNYTLLIDNVKNNWKSGIAVSLISLPLAVTLAVASHATPVQGVITAIWAGLVASILGGSNYNIIGPTGALSGLLASYTITHGIQVLPMLALLSGFFILIAYMFSFERYLFFIPSSTIVGFVCGVACIIICNQFNFALGLSNIPTHESFIANLMETCRHMGTINPWALILFISTVILLFVLARLVPHIPGTIIISPFALALGYLISKSNNGYSIATLQSKFADLHPHLNLPFSTDFSFSLIMPAVTIALISILETLISARIADGMTKTKHHQGKEMLGLGVANIASGIAGGIPATAALARTTLNIKSGCSHKASACISSIAIIVISFIFLEYFNYMPMPVIAAILTLVGLHMIEYKQLKKLCILDTTQFVITLLVAAITVIVDPIIGILCGTTISMILFMKKHCQGHFNINCQSSALPLAPYYTSPDTVVYSITGPLAYINAQSHIQQIEKHAVKHKNIVLDLRAVSFIDHDGVEACQEIVALLKREQKSVNIIGNHDLLAKTLLSSTMLNDVIHKNISAEH